MIDVIQIPYNERHLALLRHYYFEAMMNSISNTIDIKADKTERKRLNAFLKHIDKFTYEGAYNARI